MPGPRRASGATHSFRLSRAAADVVDRHPPFMTAEGRPYPRSLGGKSKLVSDAIVWCYVTGNSADHGSYYELVKRVEWWVKHCDEIQEAQISAPPMGGRRTIYTRIASLADRIRAIFRRK